MKKRSSILVSVDKVAKDLKAEMLAELDGLKKTGRHITPRPFLVSKNASRLDSIDGSQPQIH